MKSIKEEMMKYEKYAPKITKTITFAKTMEEQIKEYRTSVEKGFGSQRPFMSDAIRDNIVKYALRCANIGKYLSDCFGPLEFDLNYSRVNANDMGESFESQMIVASVKTLIYTIMSELGYDDIKDIRTMQITILGGLPPLKDAAVHCTIEFRRP